MGYNGIKPVRTNWPSVLQGSVFQRGQSNNAVVRSYKNAANSIYSTHQLDQVNLIDDINDFIVEPCTKKLQCRAL